MSYIIAIENLDKAFNNGNINNIHRCSDKNCKIKEYFRPAFNVISSVTKRSYDSIVPARRKILRLLFCQFNLLDKL